MSVGTTTAIIGAGVLGAGASVGGALINSGAASSAANTAANAQQQALNAQIEQAQKAYDILQQQYDASQKTLAPFIEAQSGAVKNLQAFADPSNPYYSQAEDYATKQIQAQLASQGLLRSRSQGDSLANLHLGLNQQRLGVNETLAGMGSAQASSGLSQAFGSNVAGLYSGLGTNIGSSLAQIGQTQAAGISAAGGAAAAGLSGVGNAVQGTLGNILSTQQQQSQLALLQQLLGSKNAGAGVSTGLTTNGGAIGGGAYTVPSYLASQF